MKKLHEDVIEACNYWREPPANTGLKRTQYLDTLIKYLGNNLIKVLIGQRRSGKSFILKQIIQWLIIDKKIRPKNIFYLNFELQQLDFIKTAKDLHAVIVDYLKTVKSTQKVYFFFDEIQEIDGWEKPVNSLLADDKIKKEIFLTGSNSKLLSSELATYITGRYLEKDVFPFSFTEYCAFHKKTVDKRSFTEYLQDSGIPELFNLQGEDVKRSYLLSLRNSILLKDIVQRFSVKNPRLLESLFHFLTDNIGNLMSLNSLVKKLDNIGVKTNTVTLSHYVNYLETAHLLFGVDRYDIKGKRILEGEKKYYLNDLGFRNYISSSFDPGLNKNLENYVFRVFKQSGFQVSVGRIKDVEIDFVIEKGKDIRYVQVTYLLQDEKVVEREYGNLELINDNWPKMVISMDEIKYPPRKGITHIQAWELEDLM